MIVADGHSDDCSHDEIVRHVKALHEARDKQRDEITSLKKQIELAEKEKYELVETMNDGWENFLFISPPFLLFTKINI